MNITITTIKHGSQRYETVGDWYFEGDHTLRIYVSDTGDWRMNLLIGLHEMIEAGLCNHRGIAEPDVLAFDLANPELDDPGSDEGAPYRKEHVFAECIERLMAEQLDVRWAEYGERVDAL